jgi:hypothetical protein
VNNATPYLWTYEDFTADSVAISSGDFWAVYIEYNNSQLATDNDSPWSGRTMTYYMGNFSADNGAYGNYMIRAVVDTTYCAGVVPFGESDLTVRVSPNPFTDRVMIDFALSRATEVNLSIYDVTGKLVCEIADGICPAGVNSVSWNGTDGKGSTTGAGIYFYRFSSGTCTHTGKLSLLR